MNNIILIRDQKIAHGTFFGSYGGRSRDQWNMLDLVTREGFFIPANTFGSQIIPYLNHSEDMVEFMQNETFVGGNPTDGGILIREDGYVCMVGTDDTRRLAVTPVTRRGIHIFSSVEGMMETMTACVNMTDSIEESVKLYRKNMNYHEKSVVIRPLEYYAQYWKDNAPPKEDKKIFLRRKLNRPRE